MGLIDIYKSVESVVFDCNCQILSTNQIVKFSASLFNLVSSPNASNDLSSNTSHVKSHDNVNQDQVTKRDPLGDDVPVCLLRQHTLQMHIVVPSRASIAAEATKVTRTYLFRRHFNVRLHKHLIIIAQSIFLVAGMLWVMRFRQSCHRHGSSCDLILTLAATESLRIIARRVS